MVSYIGTYLIIECKRILASLGRLAAGLLLPAVPVAAVMALSAFLFMRSGLFDPLDIAIVSLDENIETDRAIDLISGMESVSSVCTIKSVRESEAREGLRRGEYDVTVTIPKNFYEDVNTGVNTPIEVATINGTVGLKNIFRELIGDAARYISTSEAAIYAYTDPSVSDHLKVSRFDAEMLLTGIYMKEVASRGSVFAPSFQSSLKDLDIRGYYGAVGLSLVILLFGASLGIFFTEAESVTAGRMEAAGIPRGVTLLIRGMIIFLLHIPAFVLVAVIESAAVGISFRSFYYMIPVCLCCTCLCMLLFSVSRGRREAYLIYIMCAACMAVAGGFFFPAEYLPESVNRISALLPLSNIRICTECAISGADSPHAVIGCVVFSLIALCIVIPVSLGLIPEKRSMSEVGS